MPGIISTNYFDEKKQFINKGSNSLKNLHNNLYDNQFYDRKPKDIKQTVRGFFYPKTNENNYKDAYQRKKEEQKKYYQRPITSKNQAQPEGKGSINMRPSSSDKIIRQEPQQRLRNTDFQSKSQLQNLMMRKIQKKKIEKPHRNIMKEQASQYKKLQDKLSYLQNKIASIKNNIEQSKAKKNNLKKSQSQTLLTKKKDIKIQIPTTKNINKPQSKQKKNVLNRFITQAPKITTTHNERPDDPYSPRRPHLYYVSQITKAIIVNEGLQLAKDHINQTLNYLLFMRNIKKPSLQQLKQKITFLTKPQSYKKTIVFDLDQTLIHCNQSTQMPYDVKLPITFPTGQIIDAGINIRPYAKQIIKRLSPDFEIIIFTASHSCYANKVIDNLDPEKKIKFRLFREHCWHTSQGLLIQLGLYIKDLRILNRNLADVVLIDNAVYSYFFQQENGIPIIPYYQGKNDYQLQHLLGYIEQLYDSKDVRDFNRKYLKLEKYSKYDDPNKLVRELYPQWVDLYQK